MSFLGKITKSPIFYVITCILLIAGTLFAITMQNQIAKAKELEVRVNDTKVQMNALQKEVKEADTNLTTFLNNTSLTEDQKKVHVESLNKLNLNDIIITNFDTLSGEEFIAKSLAQNNILKSAADNITLIKSSILSDNAKNNKVFIEVNKATLRDLIQFTETNADFSKAILTKDIQSILVDAESRIDDVEMQKYVGEKLANKIKEFETEKSLFLSEKQRIAEEQLRIEKELAAKKAKEEADKRAKEAAEKQRIELERIRKEEEANNKYITINIGTQTMKAFEKGKEIYSTPITSGRIKSPTITGTYFIYTKETNRYLVGRDDVQNKDYKVWVDYWMPFSGGYGIHDAAWRKSFGGEDYKEAGSNGCVNTPDDAMIWIYNWANVGTKVIVSN
jgi:lipoprotein-anchoring transpeptidase ErfK/SrfK/type II secretory pathway pseudopilin PulG